MNDAESSAFDKSVEDLRSKKIKVSSNASYKVNFQTQEQMLSTFQKEKKSRSRIGRIRTRHSRAQKKQNTSAPNIFDSEIFPSLVSMEDSAAGVPLSVRREIPTVKRIQLVESQSKNGFHCSQTQIEYRESKFDIRNSTVPCGELDFSGALKSEKGAYGRFKKLFGFSSKNKSKSESSSEIESKVEQVPVVPRPIEVIVPFIKVAPSTKKTVKAQKAVKLPRLFRSITKKFVALGSLFNKTSNQAVPTQSTASKNRKWRENKIVLSSLSPNSLNLYPTWHLSSNWTQQ